VTHLWIAFGVGVVVGVWLGVNWADRRRAIYDIKTFAKRTWKGRSDYRHRQKR
jgi:hypothetical protein